MDEVCLSGQATAHGLTVFEARHRNHSISALQTHVNDAVRRLSEGQQIPVINIPKNGAEPDAGLAS